MDDLVAKLRDALSQDEQWALAASRPYEYADEGSVAPEGGAHWQWVAGEDWEPVVPDPMIDEFVTDPGYSCNLITLETWPVTSLVSSVTGETRVSQRPQSYANSIVEFDSAAAGHIVRHDPARVLRQVAAHRKILEQCDADIGGGGPLPAGAQDGRDWNERERDEALAERAKETLLALAEAYGIEVEEPAR